MDLLLMILFLGGKETIRLVLLSLGVTPEPFCKDD